MMQWSFTLLFQPVSIKAQFCHHYITAVLNKNIFLWFLRSNVQWLWSKADKKKKNIDVPYLGLPLGRSHSAGVGGMIELLAKNNDFLKAVVRVHNGSVLILSYRAEPIIGNLKLFHFTLYEPQYIEVANGWMKLWARFSFRYTQCVAETLLFWLFEHFSAKNRYRRSTFQVNNAIFSDAFIHSGD